MFDGKFPRMKNPNDDIRALIVSGEPFSDATATGITLCNLFGNFPREALAQLYSANFPVRDDICAHYFQLSAANLISTRLVLTRDKPSVPVRGWKVRAKSAARRVLSPFLESLSYKLPPSISEGIRVFNPNILYTLGGSLRQLQIAIDISGEMNIPLAIHFMDDWPSILYRSPWLAPLRFRLHRLTTALVGQAKVRLAISEAMASEYHTRYQAEFVPFMNCVSRSKVRLPGTAISRDSKARTICYFGGLHLGRWKSILSLAEAIKRHALNAEFELGIYCRDADAEAHRKEFVGYSFVHFKTAVPPGQVSEVMEAADALLHVESFLPEHRSYTRLSISTKIPEYLAANRPILAIGPAEVASIQYLQDHRSAIVATDIDPDEMAKKVRQLLDREVVAELGQNAFDLVMRNHLAETERERFKKTLLEASTA